VKAQLFLSPPELDRKALRFKIHIIPSIRLSKQAISLPIPSSVYNLTRAVFMDNHESTKVIGGYFLELFISKMYGDSAATGGKRA
jgi:hypothetical protein